MSSEKLPQAQTDAPTDVRATEKRGHEAHKDGQGRRVLNDDYVVNGRIPHSAAISELAVKHYLPLSDAQVDRLTQEAPACCFINMRCDKDRGEPYPTSGQQGQYSNVFHGAWSFPPVFFATETTPANTRFALELEDGKFSLSATHLNGFPIYEYLKRMRDEEPQIFSTVRDAVSRTPPEDRLRAFFGASILPYRAAYARGDVPLHQVSDLQLALLPSIGDLILTPILQGHYPAADIRLNAMILKFPGLSSINSRTQRRPKYVPPSDVRVTDWKCGGKKLPTEMQFTKEKRQFEEFATNCALLPRILKTDYERDLAAQALRAYFKKPSKLCKEIFTSFKTAMRRKLFHTAPEGRSERAARAERQSANDAKRQQALKAKVRPLLKTGIPEDWLLNFFQQQPKMMQEGARALLPVVVDVYKLEHPDFVAAELPPPQPRQFKPLSEDKEHPLLPQVEPEVPIPKEVEGAVGELPPPPPVQEELQPLNLQELFLVAPDLPRQALAWTNLKPRFIMDHYEPTMGTDPEVVGKILLSIAHEKDFASFPLDADIRDAVASRFVEPRTDKEFIFALLDRHPSLAFDPDHDHVRSVIMRKADEAGATVVLKTELPPPNKKLLEFYKGYQASLPKREEPKVERLLRPAAPRPPREEEPELRGPGSGKSAEQLLDELVARDGSHPLGERGLSPFTDAELEAAQRNFEQHLPQEENFELGPGQAQGFCSSVVPTRKPPPDKRPTEPLSDFGLSRVAKLNEKRKWHLHTSSPDDTPNYLYKQMASIPQIDRKVMAAELLLTTLPRHPAQYVMPPSKTDADTPYKRVVNVAPAVVTEMNILQAQYELPQSKQVNAKEVAEALKRHFLASAPMTIRCHQAELEFSYIELSDHPLTLKEVEQTYSESSPEIALTGVELATVQLGSMHATQVILQFRGNSLYDAVVQPDVYYPTQIGTPSSIHPHRATLEFMYSPESELHPSSLVELVPTFLYGKIQEELASDFELAKKSVLSHGTPYGALTRFGTCCAQADKEYTPLPQVHGMVEFTPVINLRYFADDMPLTSIYQAMFVGWEPKGGTDMGPLMNRRVRFPLAAINEMYLHSQFLEMLKHPEDRPLCRMLFNNITMKMKQEMYERARIFVKSRLIYSGNTATQITGYLLMGRNRHREARNGDLSAPTLLEIDPFVYVKMLLPAVADGLGYEEPVWTVYSDNLHCYHNGYIYTFDGKVFESQIQRSDVEEIMPLAPQSGRAAFLVTPAFVAELQASGLMVDTSKTPDIPRGLATGKATYRVPAPFGPSAFNPEFFHTVSLSAGDMPLFELLCGDMIVEGAQTHPTKAGVVLSFSWRVDQFDELEATLRWKFYVSLCSDVIGDGVGTYGRNGFSIPFMPSGMFYTSYANTQHMCRIRQWLIDNKVDPEDLYGHPELCTVGDLTAETKLRASDAGVLDFLGLDVGSYGGGRFLHVRYSTLRARFFYDSANGRSLPEKYSVRYSQMVGMLLNGAVFEPALAAYCIVEAAWQRELAHAAGVFLSLEQVENAEGLVFDSNITFASYITTATERCNIDIPRESVDTLENLLIDLATTLGVEAVQHRQEHENRMIRLSAIRDSDDEDVMSILDSLAEQEDPQLLLGLAAVLLFLGRFELGHFAIERAAQQGASDEAVDFFRRADLQSLRALVA